MSDGHFDGGDLLGLFLLGALLSGWFDRRPIGHTHGDYWHTHDCPAGTRVHDGHPDGPIRIVPPTPEQLAAQARRRRRRREGWALGLAVIGMIVLTSGSAGWGLTLLVLAAFVSDTTRHAIARPFAGCQAPGDREVPPTPSNNPDVVLPLETSPQPPAGLEVINVQRPGADESGEDLRVGPLAFLQ